MNNDQTNTFSNTHAYDRYHFNFYHCVINI